MPPKPVKIEEIIPYPYYNVNEIIKNKNEFYNTCNIPISINQKWKTDIFLYQLISSLIYYTRFLTKTYQINLRFYCIEHNIIDYPICKCGKKIIKVTKNSKFNDYCSQSCANRYSNYDKSIYTEEMYKKIWKTRKKNGNDKFSSKHKENLSNSHKSEKTINKFKKTCIEKYGVENPGVLGAYYSKAANKFIKTFIKNNDIDENKCYYYGGGISGKEYFQMIYDNNKQKNVYFSYDLIVFDENENISLVLEYNGPWHYSREEIIIDPNGKGVPYKTNNMSKKEIYYNDKLKLEHMYLKCKNILIYWEKTKLLQRYEECY